MSLAREPLIWHVEPEFLEYEPEPECTCIRRGDFEDVRGCPAHDVTRVPAVKLSMDDEPSEPPF